MSISNDIKKKIDFFWACILLIDWPEKHLKIFQNSFPTTHSRENNKILYIVVPEKMESVENWNSI